MDYQNWLQDVVEQIKVKEFKVVARNVDTIPYTSLDGSFVDMGKENIW